MDNNNRERKEIWFRRKRYGWGWYPANWKGWATTLVYTVLAVGGSCIIHLFVTGNSLIWPMAYLLVISILFVAIAWKMGEPPHWQWGEKKINNFLL